MKIPHIPVLLQEVIEGFAGVSEGYFVDCTLGYAGHSSAILEQYPGVKLLGIDRDQEALEFSSGRLESFGERVKLYKGSFAAVLPQLHESPITAVLADFGVSSLQLDREERGFGFMSERLDMRMDRDAALSAYEVVNTYSREKLEYILGHYGEVRSFKRVAGAIAEARAKSPIESARELSEIVMRIMPRIGKIHPATLVFQAIRIEVNSELDEIEGLLDRLEAMRPKGAIVGLITFHSLEDRLVKNRFYKWSKSCICDPQAHRCTCGGDNALGKMLGRKPITASGEEIASNPRSRSAKLRIFRFDDTGKDI